MPKQLPFKPRVLLSGGLLLAGLGLLAPAAAQAQQCPPPPACTPGDAPAANQAFGFGIVNVTLGPLSSTTAVPGGYQDYSCTQQASLPVGRRAALSVQTSPGGAGGGGAENVRVWLDYNNDGAFTGAGELVFSSDNQTQHVGSFVPPASAVRAVPLRLRVAADYVNAALPTACGSPQYGQTEDYAVVLTANALAPEAAFATDGGAVTCSGCVQFQDQSQNLPTSWRWDFGDGTTSAEASPRHCYAAPGTYPVRLTATNAAGSSTSAPTPLTYDNRVPVAAACVPATTSYCCNYGIVRFQLGTINQASADASAGYQDFSCAQRTELNVAEDYPLQITTGGTLNHATRVYLDLNNDGAFAASELLFNAPDARHPGGRLRVPAAGATLGQPLRLRVLTDFVGASLTPCGPLVQGQAEDYTVTLQASPSPPTVSVDFTSDYGPGSCGNTVKFTDLSSGGATTWLWEFGDGTTSALQNPSHTYSGPGSYAVRLTAANATRSASLSRPGFVTIGPACPPVYCSSNGSGATPGSPSAFWITRVEVTDIYHKTLFDHPSGREPGGYADYTAPAPIVVEPGEYNVLRITSNASQAHRLTVWADYDRDGTFGSDELVATRANNYGPGPAVAEVPLVLLRPGLGPGPVRVRVLNALSTAGIPDPCGQDQPDAEVEDYHVQAPGSGLATHPAQPALPGLSVFPTPLPGGQLLHLALPDARAAGSYGLSVENLLGARLLSATRRLGPTLDATLDLSTLPPGVYVLRLRDAQGREALRRLVRE